MNFVRLGVPFVESSPQHDHSVFSSEGDPPATADRVSSLGVSKVAKIAILNGCLSVLIFESRNIHTSYSE